jgi:long-chain acyl-CoA synthetase
VVETIAQLFLNTVKSYVRDGLMLHKKEGCYQPISTQDFADSVKFFSLALKDLGLKAGEKMVIISDSRAEWVMADIGNLCLGGITVPIYSSLMPEQIKYIVNDSDSKIVVFSDNLQWQKLKTVKAELKNVTHYITFLPEAPEGVLSFAQVMERGKKLAQENPGLFEKMTQQVKPDDLASIIYTSGTTGVPKGVILTHSNFISNIKACVCVIDFSEKDTVLSFLPLSHVLERMVTFTYLYKGCTIGYAESLDTLAENLLEVRPHIMVCVPRVIEKIYSRVMDNVLRSSALKRKIFFWGVKVGREFAKRKLNRQRIPGFLQFKKNLAHKLVYSKIIERTGGRVRFFISGAAPLSKDIAEFFYAMGLVVLEGYGLTETSPVISVNTFENPKFGSVGKLIPDVEVKIAEDGEILTKGPNVMKGYYKKEDETREAFKGGWFHTGDIGLMDEEGFLYITDRKKDLIVTSGGKNVAPQPIENLLKLSPYVSNAVVLGDRRRFISALVVPNFDKLKEYAETNDIPFKTNSDLTRSEQVLNFMQREIDLITPNLASYEKIKKIALLDRDFEIEKGEVTPTLKVKRNIVEEKYKEIIDALYRE